MKWNTGFGLVAGLVLLAVGVLNLVPLSERAERYVSDISSDSLKTYVSLRVLNAALSAAQEIEVSGSVGIASGSAKPFKALEPVDDAVERLSNVVFVVGSLAAVTTVLLPILGSTGFVLTGTAIFLISALRYSGYSDRLPPAIARGLVNIGRFGFIVYAAVIAFAVSGWLGSSISDNAWARYAAVLQDVETSIAEINDEDQGAAGGAEAEIAEPDPEQSIEAAEVPETGEQVEEEAGLTACLSGALSSAKEGLSNSIAGAGNTVSAGLDAVKTTTSSIADSGSRSVRVVSIISARSDDLVASLLSIFASFMFKLIVFPFLIYLLVIRLETATRPTT